MKEYEKNINKASVGVEFANKMAKQTPLDHFIQHEGGVYAGRHLIIDIYTLHRLDDMKFIEQAMLEAVSASKATLLHIHLHHFTPNNGVSGVAVLAESHISVHTWPEAGYAAFDVFMCGDANPHAAVEVFKLVFRADKVKVSELIRGEIHAETVVV